MKQRITIDWGNKYVQYCTKICSISILATLIFYSSLQILLSDETKIPISIPAQWVKIELSLHGNYMAQEGELVTIVENNGNILLPKALLLEIKKSDQMFENKVNNQWNVLLAIEPIDHQKLKILNLKKPEQLFISPQIVKEIKVTTQLHKEVKAYEITY